MTKLYVVDQDSDEEARALLERAFEQWQRAGERFVRLTRRHRYSRHEVEMLISDLGIGLAGLAERLRGRGFRFRRRLQLISSEADEP